MINLIPQFSVQSAGRYMLIGRAKHNKPLPYPEAKVINNIHLYLQFGSNFGLGDVPSQNSIILKVRPLPMYWSTLLLRQGVHSVSSTFMLRYQEVPEGIQFACSVILMMSHES